MSATVIYRAPGPAGRPVCGHEISDGNRDDPEFAYCGLPAAHAGDHGRWER